MGLDLHDLLQLVGYDIEVKLKRNKIIKGKLAYLESEGVSGGTEIIISRDNKFISIPLEDIVVIYY